MALGWPLVFQRAILVTLFRMFRLVFVAVQNIYWELNGTAKQLREASESQHYRRSAQVLDIMFRYSFCAHQNNTIKDYLCFHNRFEDPQFVIDNEHVSLMMIDEQHAYFGVPRDKGV